MAAPYFAYVDQFLFAFPKTIDPDHEEINQVLIRTCKLRAGVDADIDCEAEGIMFEPALITVSNAELGAVGWIPGDGMGYGLVVARKYIPTPLPSKTVQSLHLSKSCPMFYRMLMTQFPEHVKTIVSGAAVNGGEQEIEVCGGT